MKQIQKGFTLIELMIVVAIIGILAAVAIPAYQDYVTKAKLSKVQSTIDPLKLAMSMYFQENGAFPSTATAAGETVTRAESVLNAAVAVGSVWESIGLKTAATVPPELASLTVASEGLMTLNFAAAGVGIGIDGEAMVIQATPGGTGIIWDCADNADGTTLGNTAAGLIARKYFGCELP